jgi:2-polyprenyl-6-methoxyphenol hydroxylase-like FAD-dependent oxidoreductase
MSPPRVTTAVIGAGPAGLLFASLARLLVSRAGNDDAWALRVYDKRASYVRTHRLRIAPAMYLDVQKRVQDPRFDALIGFLSENEFAPEVNVLEERLLTLLSSVGGTREVLAIGDAEAEVPLRGLRARLAAEGLIGADTFFTIVAADSVHSAIREAVRGDTSPDRQTHEQLARIRVVGAALPQRLGAVDQARLSRVLGSIIDYRLNRNGFAEVDLFLSPSEFGALGTLHATPKDPVPLSATELRKLRAPLFAEIVGHLAHAPDGSAREVLLQSTFRLEHAVMPRLTFDAESIGASVFLVGDAGISLPFQRGMSCLMGCAYSLASVHEELVRNPDASARESIVARYDREASEIKRREIVIVRNRARLVRTLRELVRLSALLPFPIQSWWLRAPGKAPTLRENLSIWFWANVAVALAVLVLSLTWIAGVASGRTDLDVLAWTCLPIQAFGGVVYHSALAFEGERRRLVRLVWQVQLALIFVVGAVAWLLVARASAHLGLGLTPFWSLILSSAFVLGVLAFERVVARWFAWAGLPIDGGS